MKKTLIVLITISLFDVTCLHAQQRQFYSSPQEQQLNQILREIEGLTVTSPEDIPRGISLFERALNLVDKKRNPALWAQLQFALGLSLLQYYFWDRASVEKAILHYKFALEFYTRESFPKEWANVHVALSEAYSNLGLHTGGFSGSVEHALEHGRLALEVFTRQAFPAEWALANVALGNAFIMRFRGNNFEDVELAIKHSKLALEVLTREAFPLPWAICHINLGSAYTTRLYGNIHENLTNAIKHVTFALEVLTRETSPFQWAITHNVLAFAYARRVGFDYELENVELAIKHAKLALEVFTREAFPLQWATSQNILAASYSERFQGDRAENLEIAIQYANSALSVFTRESFPIYWAMSQKILGIAYGQRILGHVYENVEHAIRHLNLALEIIGPEVSPTDWAIIQLTLGINYGDRFSINYAENQEKKILYIKSSLKVFSRETFPLVWAGIQLLLGEAYDARILGDHAENTEFSIQYTNLALEVFTRETHSVQWATAQATLGYCYVKRIRGNRSQNIALAIAKYKMASEVLTEEYLPDAFVTLSINLANAMLLTKSWQQALKSYANAIKVGENLIAISAGEEAQTKALDNIREAYSGFAYCLARLGQTRTAFEVLEKSKTRTLKQSFFLQKLRTTQLPTVTRKELDALQQEIAGLEQQIKGNGAQVIPSDYTKIAQRLRDSRAKLLQRTSEIQKKLGMENDRSWQIAPLLSRLDQKQIAVVMFNVTKIGSAISVSLPSFRGISGVSESKTETIFLNQFTGDSLNILTGRMMSTGRYSEGWFNILPKFGQNERSRWQERQPQILKNLGEQLWPKLDSLLQRSGLHRILLVPQGDLFSYPLHATPFTPIKGSYNKPVYPIERYTICYTPSLQLYDELSIDISKKTFSSKALFIEDPDGNLGFALSRNSWIADKFKEINFQLTRLSASEITSTKVLQQFKQANLIHYYGHGFYNWFTPEKSGLKMYSPSGQTELLTMAQIWEQTSSLNRARLVVLSACETGITDVTNVEAQDQFTGLPASFLQAGAKAVIGSLWSVPNVETSLLFSRFYRELLDSKQSASPAEALQRAQLWLLRARPEEIDEAQRIYLGLEKGTKKLKTGKANILFSHPENWAGFYIVGDGFAEFR